MKKTGSILWIVFFSTLLISKDQSIHVYIQDFNQNPLRQVEKGVPFLLQIVTENMQGVKYLENIPGTEKFSVSYQGASQSTNIINGKRTDRTALNYVLQGKEQGSFVVGPISIQDRNGSIVHSESTSIIVGDSAIMHSVKRQPYFLEAKLSKKELYVGEKLVVGIRFYYSDEFEDLKIIHPNIESFSVGETSRQPTVGIETIRGKAYRYQEWLLKIYPEKTGTLIVPSIQATFRTAADISGGLIGLFDMFGMSSEKTVQSSARSVEVLPLPESMQHKNVSAVGQFDKIAFSLNKDKGEVGEGIIAMCAIRGIGNFSMIKPPILQLPQGLKYYEANSSMQILESGEEEKVFEYIIQGEKPGDFVIEPQRFVYFDPEKKVYRSLKTNSALLSIEGDVVEVAKESIKGADNSLSKEKTGVKEYVFKDSEIDYVVDFSPTATQSKNLAGTIVSGLLFLLMWLVAGTMLYGLYQAYIDVSWSKTYWGYFLYMRWQLYCIERRFDVFALYGLFEQFCDRYSLDLHGEKIVSILKSSRVPNESSEDWKSFLRTFLSVTFAKEIVAPADQKRVFFQGVFWMKELLRSSRSLVVVEKKESLL